MVAACEDNTDPHIQHEPGKHVIEQRHGIGWRDSAIIYITCHYDYIRPGIRGEVNELLQYIGLVTGKMYPMKQTSQMPIACV